MSNGSRNNSGRLSRAELDGAVYYTLRPAAEALEEKYPGGALDFAELLGEELQLAKVQVLVGKPQHAVSAEGELDLAETALAQRARQIDAASRRPKHRACGFNGEHCRLLVYPKSGSWLGCPLSDVGWDNRGLRFRRG